MENAANLSLLTKFPSAEYMRVEYPLLQTTSSTKIIFIYNFSTNKIFQWKSIKILAIVKKNPYERVEYIQIVHIYYIRFQAIFLRAPLKKKKKKRKNVYGKCSNLSFLTKFPSAGYMYRVEYSLLQITSDKNHFYL